MSLDSRQGMVPAAHVEKLEAEIGELKARHKKQHEEMHQQVEFALAFIFTPLPAFENKTAIEYLASRPQMDVKDSVVYIKGVMQRMGFNIAGILKHEARIQKLVSALERVAIETLREPLLTDRCVKQCLTALAEYRSGEREK